MERNPSFSGQVSVVGHSLGTVILFDLLKNQPRRHHTQSTNDTFHSSSTAMGDLVTYTHRLSYAVTWSIYSSLIQFYSLKVETAITLNSTSQFFLL